ncbi:MAG: 2Fe-2S iron-sulfur cluster-binding protein [Pseudomonadota bacterium]
MLEIAVSNPELPRGFHWLTVSDVRRETSEASSVLFDVPDDLKSQFQFKPGQYVTLLKEHDGERIRRPYSICSTPEDGTLRVCSKQVDGGRMSTFINQDLKAGDQLPVMQPMGRFGVEQVAENARTIVAICAGSGITPVISIIRSLLEGDRSSRVVLVFGNRNTASIIFRETISDLKNRFMGRLQVFHVLSGEKSAFEQFSGRLTREKLADILPSICEVDDVDTFLVCGPGGMMEEAQAALNSVNAPEDRIIIENFGGEPVSGERDEGTVATDGPSAEATIIIDGAATDIQVPMSGRVLDAALAANLDMPFACKGGMCCTCKAKLLEGEVEMALNFGLEPDEVEAGYILTCQSRPLSDKLVVDYDAV